MADRRILILDDDHELREFLTLISESQGFETLAVATFVELQKAVGDFQPDMIILDLSLDDADGVEVLRYLGVLESSAAVLLISSFEERLLKSALNLGRSFGLNMLGNLQKPLKPGDVRAELSKLPERSATVRENDLSSAISDRLLSLHFQPKVSIKTGKVLSAEALVRWKDPERGTIMPDLFIALAERSGLIEPLTEIVLDLALKEATRWRDEGLDIAVAVNLSAASLTDLEFPTKVSNLLQATQLNPSRLILEVTETTAMTDARITMDILTRLRIKGVNVSLDDFGTGYSSLVELHRMPFSELKIDRSFVMDSGSDSDARIIVEAILSLAQALGLKVVAEGVETKAHWDMLAALNCDMAQGYYMSKPLPADDFLAWVKNWHMEPASAE
ncbi:MAG: GGDEF/EAL domain-containing response regulator [Magnetovibrionaceae bacterium]